MHLTSAWRFAGCLTLAADQLRDFLERIGFVVYKGNGAELGVSCCHLQSFNGTGSETFINM